MRETLFTDNELTVETIELEDLKRTVKAKDQKGISKKLPIEHFEVFDRVLESMQSLNITPGNIFAMGGRYAKRMTIVEELKGIPNVTEAYWLQKIVGELIIHDYADSESIAKIGIKYTPEGVALAYGQEVRICQNFSILGATNYIDLSKIGLDKALQITKAWAQLHAEKREFEVATFRKMKEIALNEFDVDRAIGKLHKAAVNQAYLNKSEKAPFTIHQMTNFTKGMMSADQNDLNTLWGFYNAGTAIMRPSQNEFSTVLEQNVNWADFLLSEYSSPEVNKVFLDVKEFNNRFDGYATAN